MYLYFIVSGCCETESRGLIFCHSLSVKQNQCSTCYLTYLFKMKDAFSHLTVLQCFSVFLLIHFVCISKHRSNTDHRQGHISWDKSYRAYRHSPQFYLFKRLCLRRITWLTDIDILISEVLRTQFEILLQIEEKIWNLSPTHTQPPQTHSELPLTLPFFLFYVFIRNTFRLIKPFCWVLFFQCDIPILPKIKSKQEILLLEKELNSVQATM